MGYVMQVKVWTLAPFGGSRTKEWASIRPNRGDPYVYNTRAEAERMLHQCYPDTLWDEKRVVPTDGPDTQLAAKIRVLCKRILRLKGFPVDPHIDNPDLLRFMRAARNHPIGDFE